MSARSTRRAALGAILAAPLVSVPAPATATVPEIEARFLALVPWLQERLPQAEEAWRTAHRLYREADYVSPKGEIRRPWKEVEPILEANGYMAMADKANALDEPIVEAYEPFRDVRMTTLTALAWKARIELLLGGDGEEIAADLAALVGRTETGEGRA